MFRFFAPKKRTFFMCLILGLLATSFIGPTGHAETTLLGEQAASLGDALEKANDYAFSTGGIGIIMSYGTQNGVTAEAVGDRFVQEIQSRGFLSRYFFYNTDRDGIALSFHIRHSSLGPWGPNVAAQNINQVIDRAKAAQKILGN